MFGFGKKRQVYMDFASLTPIDKGVLGIVNKYSSELYGNPSALYTLGVNAKNALNESKVNIAKAIKAHADEIYFTGSGTEANNIAIQGIVKNFGNDAKGKNIVISAIEHSSVIETARMMAKEYGIDVRIVSVDQNGIIDIENLKENIDKNTILVSIMLVNNEIGSIEPINEIAKVIRHKRKDNNQIYPYLHTDACQAPLYIEINMEKMGVDLLTLDGHKIYGPRGVGMLYIKRGIEIKPILGGGSQESGIRSGTENIPGIAGFSYALVKAVEDREAMSKKVASLKKYFIEGLIKINKNIKINGDVNKTSPHILNISIPGIENELFVFRLDARGISCSTKSACLRDEDESYVMKAIGIDKSDNIVRFSFGRGIALSDLDYVLKSIREILQKFYK